MKKSVFQFSILFALFFSTWFTLNQVDWMGVFKIKQLEKNSEERLGDLFWDLFKKSEQEIQNKEINGAVDSILTKICKANGIDRKQIKLHLVKNDEINAFALPNKHLVIYKGLLVAAEEEGELSGVIGHELAHIEMNHVMKKLIKEVGLSALIASTTGKRDPEIIKKTAKLLSSTAYDRNLEKEADLKAVDYLIKSDIDPEPFANFLYRIADKKAGDHLSWISTHPDSKARAEYIIDYSTDKPKKTKNILDSVTWRKCKENIRKL